MICFQPPNPIAAQLGEVMGIDYSITSAEIDKIIVQPPKLN